MCIRDSSANKKAEFFYPFIASEGLDSISACEIEGRKMHVASGNKIFTSSVNLISKASASNRLQERSRDKATHLCLLMRQGKNIFLIQEVKLK